ncbi:MAG TPA: Hsp20/alpha crystallin family protein [Candidatus Latescibacteria bacterium]|nr:Hsp20/alpha crystallin family protein [Candidatus Latescibacterota bacterium]
MRGFLDIREELDRLFDDLMSTSELGYPAAGTWSPRVDVSETDDEIIVSAELPGIDREDIKVNVEDNVLTFSGEKKQEKETKKRNYHRIERSYGSFHRSFTLPTKIESDRVKATFKDGVLTIHLPKADEAKTRQIPVEVK